jgi:hypothetical protein
MCLCVGVGVRVRAYVCVCVCERERERVRHTERESETVSAEKTFSLLATFGAISSNGGFHFKKIWMKKKTLFSN